MMLRTAALRSRSDLKTELSSGELQSRECNEHAAASESRGPGNGSTQLAQTLRCCPSVTVFPFVDEKVKTVQSPPPMRLLTVSLLAFCSLLSSVHAQIDATNRPTRP